MMIFIINIYINVHNTKVFRQPKCNKPFSPQIGAPPKVYNIIIITLHLCQRLLKTNVYTIHNFVLNYSEIGKTFFIVDQLVQLIHHFPLKARLVHTDMYIHLEI